ncbi:hypothetical protein [Haliscomenobacter hydrossis]|uniref:Uncharacterized protein n=1 Tax=Haliscomenobacter hydrossis (strain ATCC 27775 / DSM 1100 / LMG 10767 / O) TaxID=760192 RepID=F4L5X1_HALH1|nr:hypothetical protein [Haliscomenobacter hydrossis]AEE52081.1 hypothetical protein Halhy_4236 [Haliscomenobacter hydrossis DSM 1100]
MNNQIKFGLSTLLTLSFALNCAIAQQSNQPEKPSTPNSVTEYQTLKKDWDEFQVKAEANAVNPAQKPTLEKDYNGLVERLEAVCEGVKPSAKSPIKMAVTAPVTPANKPKKEQTSALR